MRPGLAFLLLLLTALPGSAQDFDEVQIVSTDLGHGIWMLEGAGGNMALCVGAEGAFLVDDQYAPLTERILAAIARITDQPVRFVLNTHWHGDHTGGNENLGEAGSLIVAHDNVRRRLATEQFSEIFDRTTPPSPPAALPVVTFNDSITFHLDGRTIEAFHVPPAHTDGDAVVHFVEADVLHMGDVFWNGEYPFIDYESGGRIEGIIAAVERVLPRVGPKTRVLAGHGPVGGRAELEAYLSMLQGVRAALAPLVEAGQGVEEIVALRPTAAWDGAWGGGWLKPADFVGIVAAGMGAKKSESGHQGNQ
jgi:glyoxylase-like metal-dependent hydrolase (beta-lactamase superfamily II)